MKDKNVGPLAARVRRCAALGSAALLALTALLSGVAAARAQEPAPTPVDVGTVEALSQGLLKIDEGRTGNLTVDAPAQWWTLPLKAGDAIFITANAEADAALYPQLSLFDPAGNLLSQADNASGSTNVVIPNVTAPQDGNHYVRVTGRFQHHRRLPAPRGPAPCRLRQPAHGHAGRRAATDGDRCPGRGVADRAAG
ncbi:MAG: PPC domain-containing protein [Anaerolineae bacterium]|nr:PPC domain-containing protein [Anaerolineae bacterium]